MKNPNITFIIRLLLITGMALLASNCSHGKQFHMFDLIGQRNKPDLSQYGFKRIKIMPANAMWPKNANKDKPDIEWLKNFTKRYSDLPIICLDIEHWTLHGDNHALNRQNKNYLIDILNVFRESFPDSKIGYYGIMPIRNYWTPVKNKQEKIVQWQNWNKSLSDLAAEVDIIFPSIYTFYKDKENWKKYAIKNLQEARQYNKPVYAFLWPQYHRSNKWRAFDFIDGEYWKMQLETAYQYADGIVIWTPSKKWTKWDKNSEWWQETINFIQEKELSPRTSR